MVWKSWQWLGALFRRRAGVLAFAMAGWFSVAGVQATPPTLVIDDVTVSEGDSGSVAAVFTVRLSAAQAETVTVDFETSGGSAFAGVDFTPLSGLLTFAPGETTQTVSVQVVGDVLDETDESFFVYLANATNGIIADGEGLGTILDDDPLPVVSIDDMSVSEGGGGFVAAVFNVSLSGPSGRTVSVGFATANGTATAGSDYFSASGTVTFPAGTTTQTVSIVVVGDVVNEADETFYVDLSNPLLVTVGKSRGTGTILNDDAAPGLSINDVTVSEGNAGTVNATFTLTLSAASGQTVTVDYATADGTAVAGLDYVATNGTVSFPAGTTSRTVSVAVKGDVLNEGTETFQVQLSNAVNATLSDGSGQGTISNDDPLPSIAVGDVTVVEGDSGEVGAVFVLTLSAASGRMVEVDYATADGTAVAGSDYVAASGHVQFAAGTTQQTVTVQVKGDTLDEAAETFVVNLSGPVLATVGDGQGVGTISDDDAAPVVSVGDASVSEGDSGSVNAVFTVSLSAASGQTVTVGYATADGTAQAGPDYTATNGTVTFPPGTVSRTVSVAVKGDTLSEATETFYVNLSNPVLATVGDGQGLGTINDQDPLPTVSVGDAAVAEGNSGTTNAVFTVTLSTASGQTVTVGYATADGTAEAGSDYTGVSGTVSLPAGTTSATVSVPVIGDGLNEADETFALVLSNPVAAVPGDGQGTGTIVNDDPLPAISVGDVTVTEGDSGQVGAVFVLTLSAASGRMVEVDYGTANGTAVAGVDYTAASGHVQFAPGQTERTVTVQVAGDTLSEADETFLVNLTSPVLGTVGDGQGVGTINDDDPVPVLTVGDVTVEEGDSGSVNAVFVLSLSAASGQAVTVNYATADGTAQAGSDYTAVSGMVSFAPGTVSQTVSVAVLGDMANEPVEFFYLNVSGVAHATVGDGQGLGTINDQDPEPLVSVGNVTVAEGNSGTTNAVLVVSLSAASGYTVTVDYATADGTAQAGSDYVAGSGTVTFAPGTTQQTVVVGVNGDTLSESNEVFTVVLSGPVHAVVGGGTGSGTIMDDDALPSLSINDVVVVEGNSGTANAVFTVSLSAVSGRQVRAGYASSDGSAAAGTDYVGASGTVDFPAGVTVRTVVVNIVGDTLNEADETFYVTLTGPENAVLGDGQGQGTINNDDAAVSISINDVSVAEGDSGTTNAVFTVSLSAASGQTITVNYATGGGGATAGADYTAGSGTVTFPPGTTNQAVAVAVVGDTLDETNETFLVTLSGPVHAVLGDGVGQGTIVDDDATPSVTVGDVAVVELDAGPTNAVFVLTLSAASGRTVSVSYATGAGSATAGADYTTSSGVAVFAPGTTTVGVTVSVLGDLLDEDDEVFNLNLSSPTNATLARSSAVGTIVDNDPLPALTAGDVTVKEGNSGTTNAVFNVGLSAASGRTVTVGYATADGTAVAGPDYTAGSGTVTFTAGVTNRTVSVAVKGETLIEPTEVFYVDLSGAVNATVARSRGTGTILDDESRTTVMTNASVITIPSLGAAAPYPSLIELSGLPGVVSKATVTLSGLSHTFPRDLDVLLVGPDGQKVLLMSDVGGTGAINNVTLTFDDAAAGSLSTSSTITSGTYKPSRDATSDSFPAPAPEAPYSDLLATVAGIDPNGTWALYVVDDASGDSGAISGGWRLTLTMTNLACCSSGAEADLSVTVQDSPDPALNGSTLTYFMTVINSGPAAATGVTVSNTLPAGVSFTSASASQGSCSLQGGNVICPLGSLAVGAAATVAIRAVPPDVGMVTNRALVFGNEADGVAANNMAETRTQVNLAPPTLSIDDVSVEEADVTTVDAIFNVTLSRVHTQTVTVSYATSSGTATVGTDYQAASGSLTFPPGTTNQTITVVVNGDQLIEPNETFRVTLSSPVNATLARSQGTGTIVNDDAVAGALDHFAWDTIGSTQVVNMPFPVSVTAVDPGGNPITSFSGTVDLSGLVGSGPSTSLLITEVDTDVDRVELANVTGFALDVSGWSVTLYDWLSWPDPVLTFAFPPGTMTPPGALFTVQDGGVFPGVYPAFFTGTNVAWLNEVTNNQVAVLLRNGAGQIVDFVCAVDAFPSAITTPLAIPSSQWSGNPIAANLNAASTYQRTGSVDHQNSSDWPVAANSIGATNAGLSIPFPGPSAVSISPTVSGPFVNGVWSGQVTVMQLATNMYLRADDGAGHSGSSGTFSIQPASDLALSLAATPELARPGGQVNYTLRVTNNGPTTATGVMVVDTLPAGASFVSAVSSQGSNSYDGFATVSFGLGSIGAGQVVTGSVVIAVFAPGTITNSAVASHLEFDPVPANNSVAVQSRVNFTPTLETPAAQVTFEDTPTSPIPFTVGDVESDPGSLVVFASSSNPVLVPVGNVLFGGAGAERTVTVIPALNQFGSATITLGVSDGLATNTGAFVITVNAVNDPPGFVAGPDQTVLEDSGARMVSNWASSLSVGPANEAGQTLSFLVSNDNNGLFSAQPAVSASGTLSYTPATNANGSATVTVQLKDNGGTANGGSDTSAPATFHITVTAVNDAPSWSAGTNVVVSEDTGGVTLPGWAGALSAGPGDEAGQTLSFALSNDQPGLFAVAPALSASGTLTFTTATNAAGTATVTAILSDNGGTANGGVNTAAARMFTITLSAVNDPPVLAALVDRTVAEGSTLTFTNSASDPDVPANTLTYSLDPGAPAGATIDAVSGVFSWAPTEIQAPSTNVVAIRVTDNGTPPLSQARSFTLVASEVNQAPAAPMITDRTIPENAAFSVSLAASDADIPANVLSYLLVSGPPGAAVDGVSGLFTWTPNETQGGAAYPVTARVVDNGSPALSNSVSFVLTVSEVNSAPALTAITNRTVAEGSLLTFTNVASDADLPANTLTFSLDAGAPAGAMVDPVSGVFAWTPGEADGPGTYTLTVRVTDNGSPPRSAAQGFTVTVNEVNAPPTLSAVADQVIDQDTSTAPIPFTIGDPETSADQLQVFASSSNAGLLPAQGIVLGGTAASRTVRLTPAAGQTGAATVTLRVLDPAGGEVTETFRLTVRPVVTVPPIITRISLGQGGVSIEFLTVAGRHYSVLYSASLAVPDWRVLTALTGTGGVVMAIDSSGVQGQRFYRVLAE